MSAHGSRITSPTGSAAGRSRSAAAGEMAHPLSTGPPRITPERELELVEAHRAGDPEALGELLQAYQRRVYTICFRMLRNAEEAADLTQDALVKVLEGLAGFDGRSKLSTWVVRVTMNCCLSHLRKERLRQHASLDGQSRDDSRTSSSDSMLEDAVSSEPAAAELSPSDRVEQEERSANLQKAMMKLEPEARAVLVLRDMQGLDYEQIGEALELPLGTVKSRLFRARAALRTAVESLVA